MKINKETRYTDRFFRQARRWISEQDDREILEEFQEGLRESMIAKNVPTYMMDQASLCIYEAGALLQKMPMQRLPNQEHLAGLDGLALSKRIDELRRAGDNCDLATERELLMLTDEWQLRKFNAQIEANIAASIKNEAEAVSQQKADEQLYYQGEFDRLSAISEEARLLMSSSEHEIHYAQLIGAARVVGIDIKALTQLADRQASEGESIVRYENQRYELEHRRDPFNASLKRPDYEPRKSAKKNLAYIESQSLIDQKAYDLAESEHVEGKRAEYNGREVGVKAGIFNAEAIKAQFAHECKQAAAAGLQANSAP